jgi:hypothetical protein
MGGRRRTHRSKTSKTSKKHVGRRHSKKVLRGGMGYGFQGPMGTNGPVWGSSWGGEVTKGGEPVYGTGDRPATVGGRRRGTRKGSKRSRSRKMKGGATWISPGQTGYGYTGTGARGLADATPYASRVPPSGAPSQNADGAYHV